MTRADCRAFFETYRDAFDRLDGDAVADLWHMPSAIADTAPGASYARVTGWAAAAPMRENMRALCELYRRGGYHAAEFEFVAHQPLGRDQSFATLRWTLRRADGSVLQRFATGYHLVRAASGFRVLAAAAFEENIQGMKTHAAQ